MILYRAAQWLVRTAWPLLGRLDVEGLEQIPSEGPFLLIANHQSYLDPILVQALVRRPVYTMAKSTQFSGRITGPLLERLNSFPVRRFEIDPQAVRLALRHLESGHGVGIYLEGERSWDGRLQAPRLGTIRLALKAGAPVVPCGVSGTYDIWPRWDRRLRRAPTRVRFGRPLRFEQLHDRQKRESALPAVRETLLNELSALAGVERGSSL